MNAGDPALHLYDNLVPLMLTMIDTMTVRFVESPTYISS